MRKVNYKEKGITLIALVITIIILLILAGVTLSTALSDNGLFKRAKEAGEKYKESERQEDEALKSIEDEIDGIDKNKDEDEDEVIERSELKVGDVINYMPKTNQTTYSVSSDISGCITNTEEQIITQGQYIWKIMNINEDNSIELIGIPNGEITKLGLNGVRGYNNGIYLLNDICNTLYKNTDLNAEARNINMTDIELKFSDKAKSEIASYSYSEIQYGSIGRIEKGYIYPALFEYENGSGIDTEKIKEDGIDHNNDGTKLAEITIPLRSNEEGVAYKKINLGLYVKQNYFNIQTNEEYYKDINFYNLLVDENVDFWIATRTQYANSGRTGGFGIQCFFKNDKEFKHGLLVVGDQDTGDVDTNYCLCPIVTLNSDIKIVAQEDGSYILKK